MSDTLVEGGSTFYSLQGFHWDRECPAPTFLSPSNLWMSVQSYQAKFVPRAIYVQTRFDRLGWTLVVRLPLLGECAQILVCLVAITID